MLLDNFIDGKPVVVYDTREAKSFVVRYLKGFKDITTVRRSLEIADYLVRGRSKTIAVERKRASDFLASVSDGRLFTQLEHLLEYEDPRLILEGAIFTSAKSGRCYSIDTLGRVLNPRRSSKKQPRAMWSTEFFVHPHALVAIFEKMQEMGIKVIPTGSAYDTADVLRHWATRGDRREYLAIRHKSKAYTDLDRQLFLLAGLIGISTKRAEALLKAFGSPMKVFHAFLEYSPKKFPVEGIGEKTASEIRKLLTANLLGGKTEKLTEYEFRERIAELEDILREREASLRRKSVPELKKMLREKGLRVTGRKEELIERLLGSMKPEEKVNIPLFIEKYERLLRLKTDFQGIPRRIEKAYEKLMPKHRSPQGAERPETPPRVERQS
jgi:ERCC4-type nuclease